MSDLTEGDRVTLVRDPQYKGTVAGPVIGGYAFVRFDTGGGANFAVDALVREGKAWPPGLETK